MLVFVSFNKDCFAKKHNPRLVSYIALRLEII